MPRIQPRCPTGDFFSPQAKRDFNPPHLLCQARQILTLEQPFRLPPPRPQIFADEIAALFAVKLLKEKRLANALLFAEMSTAVSGERAL
jgi:hypothetical protein